MNILLSKHHYPLHPFPQPIPPHSTQSFSLLFLPAMLDIAYMYIKMSLKSDNAYFCPPHSLLIFLPFPQNLPTTLLSPSLLFLHLLSPSLKHLLFLSPTFLTTSHLFPLPLPQNPHLYLTTLSPTLLFSFPTLPHVPNLPPPSLPIQPMVLSL